RGTFRRPWHLRSRAWPGRAVLREPQRYSQAGNARDGADRRRAAGGSDSRPAHPADLSGGMPERAGRGRPDRGGRRQAGGGVLYQEANDPQLIARLPASDVQQLEARTRALRLGALPPAPSHRFQGRSRELLALERLLHQQPYAVVRGQGGAGKTTLAAELARW